jgi:hypothetical protein
MIVPAPLVAGYQGPMPKVKEQPGMSDVDNVIVRTITCGKDDYALSVTIITIPVATKRFF